jgi:hypothetical protein
MLAVAAGTEHLCKMQLCAVLDYGGAHGLVVCPGICSYC